MAENKNIIFDREKLLPRALAVLPYGLLLFNEENELLYSNRALEAGLAASGAPQEQIHSVISQELKAFRDSSRISEVVEKSLSPNLFLEISLNKISSPDQPRVAGTIVLVRNITEYKKADFLKSDFIYMVAHELKTPLTSITGPVSLLLGRAAGAINDNQAKFLLVIKKNAERLARLLGNLTDLARIESGKIVLKKSRNNMLEALAESMAQVSLLLKEKNIQIRENISADLPEFEFDFSKIEQVLVNLLTNAVKFSNDDSEIILAARQITVDGGRFVAVSVIDQGLGIHQENLTRIFDKFFQVDTPQKGKGTGLGLTIARYIVEAHGGRIWAESPVPPGKEGSKITFTLPL